MKPMNRLSAAAIAAIALAATPAAAADLFGTAAPPMLDAPAMSAPTVVEIGSNWYIRGDVGLSIDNAPTISTSAIAAPPPGNAATPISANLGPNAYSANFTIDLGFGYRFNNYFRLDAEYDYRTGTGGSSTATVVCPYNLTGLTSQTPDAFGNYAQLGYLYNTTNTCNGTVKVSQHNNMGLINAYLDLGSYWGVMPYIGAGVGVNANTMSGTLNYFQTSNGAPYAPNLTPTGTYPQIWIDPYGNPINPKPNIAFNQQNWNRTISSTKYTPAWALMVGFGIPITPSAMLDIGYRYLNTGTSSTLLNPATGTILKQTNSSQQIKIGIRYMIE
jgi:opacity protein-like surface antigen